MKYRNHLPRRQLRRLKGYNYAKAGAYFVTLNCKNQIPLFGEIKEGKMILNEYGIIAQQEWSRTPKIRLNIRLDTFIVMPDHIHGIIIIEKEIKSDSSGISGESKTINTSESKTINTGESKTINTGGCKTPETAIICGHQVGGVLKPPRLDDLVISGGCKTPNTQIVRNPYLKSPSQTLGAILRGFMGTVTSQINTLRNTPGEKIWQRGFHDHIIRNKWSYHRISMYINNNPKKWKLK